MFETVGTDQVSSEIRLNNKEIMDRHNEYDTLLIDIFNRFSYDSFLRHLTISLISRYESERAGFVRNLNRTIILLGEDANEFFNWTQDQLDKFVLYSENASSVLLKLRYEKNYNRDNLENDESEQYLNNLLDTLKGFTHQISSSVVISKNANKLLKFKSNLSTKFKVNLFKNVKVYDYLISFVFDHKDTLIMIYNESKSGSNSGNEILKASFFIFKEIFKILEIMIRKNPEIQSLM